MMTRYDDTLRHERRLYLLLGVICVALLGGALYLQYGRGEDPCPLCILQRYAYALIAIFAFGGAASRSPAGIGAARWLSMLAALGGAGAAGYLIWVQSHPSMSCGYDAVEAFVDGLPTARWLPSLFKVQGLCQTVYPPLLGLSLPTWSLIGFVLILLTLLLHRPLRHPSQSR
ncbi:disulfide bond formation protein B [Pandoraea thiooxydans]|nr:disulfide bond formation protein B [Pandoraea thiooxydans]